MPCSSISSSHERDEALPVGAARLVDEDDRQHGALPVWISVSASKPSSHVPKPPGKSAMACASLTKTSLRVKKYLKLMSLGSPAIHALASCSNGSRMFRPNERSRPAPVLGRAHDAAARARDHHPARAAMRLPNSNA